MKEVNKVVNIVLLIATLISCYITNLAVMFISKPMEILVANVIAWVLIGSILTFIKFINWVCEEEEEVI